MLTKLRTRIHWLMPTILLTQTVYAANDNYIPTVFSLSAGPMWASGGSTQTLNLADEITKTYTAQNPSNVAANFAFFAGVTRSLPKCLLAQIGLTVANATSTNLAGDIWDDADPEFDNYDYQYKLSHFYLGVQGKLFGNFGQPIAPWISASVGVGFNRAYGFTNTPKIYEALPNTNFASNTTTAFSYTLGVGIERRMTQNFLIGIGYEFADWGKSQLGSAEGQTTSDRITVNHFYTNSLLINFTYDSEDKVYVS